MNGLTHHQDKYAANDFTHQQDTYAMNDLPHQQDKYATNDLTHQQDTYATSDFTHQQNTYATSDLTHQQYNQQDYSYYNENKPTPATADGYYTAPNPSSQVDVNEAPATVETEKYARGNSSDKRSCCDLLCCGCCTCYPQWCRYILCIIFLIIVVLGITAGILAALFKKPSVEFTGVQGSPIFGLTGNKVNLNVSLGFTVNNPNVESATFSTLTATAFYHGDTTELGGGTLHDLYIGSHSVTNISFPFALNGDQLFILKSIGSLLGDLVREKGANGVGALASAINGQSHPTGLLPTHNSLPSAIHSELAGLINGGSK
ncbi:unnamed protein product [Mucor hiemalis]